MNVVYSAKQKALYVIHKRVANKFPHHTHKQMWAITYALYNKATKKLRGETNEVN